MKLLAKKRLAFRLWGVTPVCRFWKDIARSRRKGWSRDQLVWFAVGAAQSGMQARGAQRPEEGLGLHCGLRSGLTSDQIYSSTRIASECILYESLCSADKAVCGLNLLNIVQLGLKIPRHVVHAI